MTSGIVVDIGNSRMKWGRVRDSAIVNTVSLASDNPLSWIDCIYDWQVAKEPWVIASVDPKQTTILRNWLGDRPVSLIRDYRDVPIALDVDRPEQVGVDRLLNAFAASRRFPNRQLIVSSIGTAVTIDRVSRSGVFQGGMILPGIRLMAEALGQQTAQLPTVSISSYIKYPARNTESAIQCGILSAIRGAILYSAETMTDDMYIFTGGDAGLFADDDSEVIPMLTLEGIRLAAEAST